MASHSGGSCVEVKVVIKNDEQSFTQDFLSYDPLTLMHDCPELKKMIEEAEQSFKGDADEIILKFKMVWR